MIPPIKTILLATDLSKNSAYAFYYAVQIAKRVEAKVVILHAVEPLPPMLIALEISRIRLHRTAGMRPLRNSRTEFRIFP